MLRRMLPVALCLAILSAVAWIGTLVSGDKEASKTWVEVAKGIRRTPGFPAGYALIDGDQALLIDAPEDAEGLKAVGVKKIDGVLLTHHHRDSCAAAGRLLAAGIPVRAPKASAEWLTKENVRKYWQESLPLRNSRTAYLVVPKGLDGVDCSLEDGQRIDWHGWQIQVVATPGHSRDHVAYVARKRKTGPLTVLCGDALASSGKLWSPYTTDWDHWTDAGLTPTAQSLRKLAALKPALLLPAHGEPITKGAVGALTQTAQAVEELAFLKSFERYTKKRVGNEPKYRFLAKEQAETNGSKPWSQISEHLFLTGNTYVLTSKENAFLVVDPWDKWSANQVLKLQKDRQLGRLEVVMFSHAHFDHYDGIYHLPNRDKFQVWTLDRVAPPIADPNLLRAPFLDPRPVKVDRPFKDGETATWHEYRFRFSHFPGQTEFTMAVETTIDGKKCLFTADNFFHQDQFSGTGGWMGLNRSYPLPYAASAQKVLDVAPDWVLAEHGGAFEFHPEDFRRRVEWGKVSARAADVISVSGNHRYDWDPHRIHVEPLIQKAKAGETIKATLVLDNPLDRAEKLTVVLEGRGLFADLTWTMEIPAKQTSRQQVQLKLAPKTQSGRHVFTLRAVGSHGPDEADAFLAVDVQL